LTSERGALIMRDSEEVIQLLERQKSLGKLYAASGAAPAQLLADAGLSAPISTCYPMKRLRDRLEGPMEDDVVIYNNIVTSQGTGLAFLFAIELGELLIEDTAKANLVARKRLVDRSGKLGFRRKLVQEHRQVIPFEPPSEDEESESCSPEALGAKDMPTDEDPGMANSNVMGSGRFLDHQSTSICKRFKCNMSTLRKARDCRTRFLYVSAEHVDGGKKENESTADGGKKRPHNFSSEAMQSTVWKTLSQL
jgi:hypothetical protein